MLQYNMLETINTAVSAMGTAAQIEWEFASEVRRDNPLVLAMNFSEDQLDAMFLEASVL